MAEWTLHFDGLYEPRYTDRGVATYGFVVARDGHTIHEEAGLVAPPGPLASANVAEYGALIQGLAWLRDHAPQRERADEPVHVRGDSRLVIETVARRWNLTSPRLIPLRDAALSIANDVGIASWRKVSREENQRADELSRRAYHALTQAHPEWGLGPAARWRHPTDRPTRAPQEG